MAISTSTRFNSVDQYIRSLPPESKEKIIELRSLIKKVAPEAEELISYNMPSFNYYSRLVYYAAFKSHIGFYPMASGIAAFKNDISKFKWAKGSVQFPIDKPLPVALITKIIRYRIKENKEKFELKAMKKKAK
jgi:uncharacterized protein YdhG (YjbR/CyaY superfamily)